MNLSRKNSVRVIRSKTVIANRPLVEMVDVSRRFELERERHRSFQDSFIRLFHRQQANGEEFWPLRDVSLTIYPGDCIGVIGPNGTGKSTLLKVISGILLPTSGSLTVHGRVSSLLELGAGFHPDLTGRENIFLNGSIYGLSRHEMQERLDDIVEYAELGEFIDTPIKHYSSGMHVRLGFAVAIHTKPDLLLIDEVLAVGDASFQRKCMSSIHDFRQRGGTIVLVSHDIGSIQSICERALWIEEGQVKVEGDPTDVVMAYLASVARKEEAKQQEQQRRNEEKSSQRQEAEAEAASDEEAEVIQRWGSGCVKITQVELLDAAGQARSNFHNGEQLSVRLHYYAAQPVEKPIFGLAIYHQQGAHICGPNTKFGGLELPTIHGAGVIDYTIHSLPLLQGEYRLSVAVVNHNDSETFDYLDRTVSFYVYPGASRERYGMVSLDGSWKLGAIDRSAVDIE
jgi:ABC-type polysaccharide/polyol phosphate transport system ATPase subunit